MREKRGLLVEMEELLRKEGKRVCGELELQGEERREMEREYEMKVEMLRSTFEVARMNEEEGEGRREVPDWAIDGISFSVMVDPVVVRFAPFPPLCYSLFIPFI